eukprot:gene18593-25105_t
MQFKADALNAKFNSFSRFPLWTKTWLCLVVLIDEFENPKKGKTSNCFRITYRSMERVLTDDEINALQNHAQVHGARVD